MSSLRFPIWPGVRLRIGGTPKPEAVRVVLGGPWPPADQRTINLVSKRGWMLLLVRYDWRSGMPEPSTVRVIRDEESQ